MTRFELEVFKKALCPHDDDYSYPCIAPEYLEQELEDIFLSLDEHTENEDMKKDVSVGEAVDMIISKIAEAVENESVPGEGFIRKPLSWALFKTWRYFDEHEKERKRT